MKKGTLYGVGVGPGDPELMTLKAVRVIRQCAVTAIPSEEKKTCVAYHIARQAVPELEEKEILAVRMPMTRDREVLEESYRLAAERVMEWLDEGVDVAFLTLGDPSIYSTYLYVHERVKAKGYPVEMISGIPSFCAVSARLKEGLVNRSQRLFVVPASYQEDVLPEEEGTYVYMKAGRKTGELAQGIELAGETFVMVENCGMEGERIIRDPKEIPDRPSYYSMVIVKKAAQGSCRKDGKMGG